MLNSMTGFFYRFAANGWIPSRWFLRNFPNREQRSAQTGTLHIEIVSHCWNYAHLLIYQLSSLLENAPQRAQITMTVFSSIEDQKTQQLMAYFSAMDTPGIRWNLRNLEKEKLFRRAIGRNIAALESTADWIWFTDCDLLFGPGCLDSLSDALQGLRDPLVFPKSEFCTDLLNEDADLLRHGHGKPGLRTPDYQLFQPKPRTRATGPLQITHGDIARACGYCRDIGYYQQPSPKWCKAHEDRAFRWLLNTQGRPVDVQSVYRIRHAEKGRYTGSSWQNSLRRYIRRIQDKKTT